MFASVVVLGCLATFFHLYLLKAARSAREHERARLERLEKSYDLNRDTCDPIIKDAKQFRVNIDGEFYPKVIPAYFNASLNFSCIRARSRRTKLILLWAK
jgi:hypothetical protein